MRVRIGDILKRGKGPVAAAAPAEDAFAVAMRHSRRVRFLRKAIPAGCVGAVALSVMWSVLAPFTRSIANVSMGPINLSGSKITMEAPKLSGFRKDQKAYEVTAREAVQDVRKPSLIELIDLTANLETDPKQFARLEARTGLYDTAGERLDLKGDVTVRVDSGGYRIGMLSARVDMKSGNVDSNEAVTVSSAGGTIEADSVQVRENGKYIVFEGRVRSVFNYVDLGPQAAGQAEARSP
jgi:lipopolysaccharide export system protein LptC